MTRSRRVVRVGFVILAVLCGSGAGMWADLRNGGFEEQGAYWSSGPPGFVGFDQVEFFDPSPSYAAVLEESQPGNDTYLEQTFQLEPGETTLRFDYRLDVTGPGLPETDYLRVSLDGHVGGVDSTSGLRQSDNFRQGTWSGDILGFLEGPDFTLRFILVGESDNITTTVAIDNVSCAVVPVPGAILLGAVGLSCAAWRLRRGARRSGL